MSLEKKEDVVWMLWVLNMALGLNLAPIFILILPKPTSPRGHVSAAAVFSEYGSCEWLIRETYKRAGCYVLGAKLLQFFESSKFL